MNARFEASIALQAPEPVDVCPHCKRETRVFVGTLDGKPIDVPRCTEHGDVIPMRSAVVNRDPA